MQVEIIQRDEEITEFIGTTFQEQAQIKKTFWHGD